ncbi:ABC transporter permease [Roseomonas elaeocarpi]|uniref:ABC transporter permease n=1 Tax=Roseomonas elaeocarpi TaxID=907779 RepID=A0ABV6JPI6_9PROT
MDFAFLGATMARLLAALPMTLQLTALSLLCGGILALLLSGLRATGRLGAGFVSFYVFCFRGSPLLVQIFLIYYGLGQFPAVRHSILWPILREPYACALIALALNEAAYTTEILRGGLRAVPRGAVEAARVCGMSRTLALRRVVLPLAIRQALPAYGNEIISMCKSTSLASIVTLLEVTGTARAIISETYRTIEVFLCAAAIYLVLTFLLSRLVWLLERWLNPHRAKATT